MMLVSILKMKCPRCHKGDMFKDKNPYHLKKVDKMNAHCPCCGENLEPEPGFYFGAMYVSYGLGVIFFLLAFYFMYIVIEVEGWVFLTFYSLTLLVLWPVIFRISRVIYLYLFVRYDKKACPDKP